MIRRSLPKFQQRRLGYAPQKLANLEGHWEEHFQQLEIGLQTTSEELSLHCTQVQQDAAPSRPTTLRLDQLPSLIDLEDAFRQTQVDRSTGLDPVPSAVYHRYAPALARAFYQLLAFVENFCLGHRAGAKQRRTSPHDPEEAWRSDCLQLQGNIVIAHFRKAVARHIAYKADAPDSFAA